MGELVTPRARHDTLVSMLFNHPKFLGIDENLILSKVMELELRMFGKLFVVPDIHITTFDTDFYYEVKSTNNPEVIMKGLTQISRTREWLDKYGERKVSIVGIVWPKHGNIRKYQDLEIKYV